MEINSSGSAILYLQLEINSLQKKSLSVINLDTTIYDFSGFIDKFPDLIGCLTGENFFRPFGGFGPCKSHHPPKRGYVI